MIQKSITDKIIKSFYTVYNVLGYGFLEKVYENALKLELEKNGLNVVSQIPIKFFYDDKIVGEFFTDLLIENKVIVELKSCEYLSEAHEAQLINYLKATGIEVGLLLNFGKNLNFHEKSLQKVRSKASINILI